MPILRIHYEASSFSYPRETQPLTNLKTALAALDPINTRAYFYTPQDSVMDGTIQLVLNVKGEDGSDLMAYRSEKIPLSSSTGEWNLIELDETSPETVSGVKVDKVQALLTIDGAQDAQVYVDDFEVWQ